MQFNTSVSKQLFMPFPNGKIVNILNISSRQRINLAREENISIFFKLGVSEVIITEDSRTFLYFVVSPYLFL